MLRILVLVTMLPMVLPIAFVQGDDGPTLSESIDRHIQSRLDADGIERVPQADDATFLRRAFLDLHGVIPSAEQAAQFLESRDPDKRSQLIEELLESQRFGEHLGDVWRGYLISPLVNEQRVESDRFASWLSQRFNQNAGWDKIAFDLLTATGKMEDNPAVTYLIEGRLPLGVTDLTDLSSRYFLGVRLNCAQCHDHPFVEWKQKDYWGMAAFFTEIQTPGRPKVVYMVGIKDDPRITFDTLKTSDMLDGFQSEPPTFLGGEESKADASEPRRVQLARWITSAENPYFARAMVNRMWWHFFGRGIVNPVDDMHTGHAPSHPKLLELLSQQFAESGFDLKFLCRAILNSRTYQQTSRPGKDPQKEAELFARMSPKVFSPEQLYDSLVTSLGPPGKAPGINARFGARHEFTGFFRGDGDSEPGRYERGIPHVLRLMNSPQFAGRNLDALVQRIAKSEDATDEVVDELFLTLLSRKATSKEQKLARDHLQEADGSAEIAYRELAWALMMTSEFTLNH
jgi:hypothetical protein